MDQPAESPGWAGNPNYVVDFGPANTLPSWRFWSFREQSCAQLRLTRLMRSRHSSQNSLITVCLHLTTNSCLRINALETLPLI